MVPDTKPWYTETWWYYALYAVLVILNYTLGLGIDVAALVALVLPLIAMLFGDRWVEVQRLRMEIKKYELEMLNRK